MEEAEDFDIDFNPIEQCALCHLRVGENGITKLNRCSSCLTFCYCSKEHQKSDWKEHKSVCKYMKTMMNDSDINREMDYGGHGGLALMQAMMTCTSRRCNMALLRAAMDQVIDINCRNKDGWSYLMTYLSSIRRVHEGNSVSC